MKRRSVLAAGVSLAGAALSSALRASAEQRAGSSTKAKAHACDVVVIGAGLAGLNAALTLQAAGRDVLVVEARDRVGGRLESVSSGGLDFELGAVEVGENYARFLARASSLGVPLVKSTAVRIPGIAIGVDGKLLSEAQWAASPLNPMPAGAHISAAAPSGLRALTPGMWLPMALSGPNPLFGKGKPSDFWQQPANATLDVPLYQYLQTLGFKDANVLRMMEIASNYNDFAQVSALDVLRRDALRRAAGPTAGTLAVQGGSQALPIAMAKALKRPVAHAEVVRVQAAGKHTVEIFAAGQSAALVRAKSVIVAVAAPAMAGIQIALPGFDRLNLQPLWQRPMTRVTTVHFRPTENFWEMDGLSPNMWLDGPLERVFAAANAQGKIERLIVWMNGRAAAFVDALGSELPRFVALELARMRPSTRGKLEFLAARSWGEEKFSGGAYVEIAAGQCQPVARAHSALQSLPKAIALAGEHLAFDHAGMEAALASGERAALRMLAV